MIWGLKFKGYSLLSPKLLTKYGMMDWLFKLRQNCISCEIINILEDFLGDRKQKVVLNGQCLSWADIHSAVPQGFILGPLLFLIYINDLSNDIKSKCKLFAVDTSLFSVAHDIETSANDLNHDLEKISEWAFQSPFWKLLKINPYWRLQMSSYRLPREI